MHGRRVLVGVCGSIAAYKLGDVVRGLIKQGADVRVVMTPSATRFVAPATFAALTAHDVQVDVFDDPSRVVHVELGHWADLYLIGAATASTLARLATGSAEEIVSATALMCRCPVIVAPAMHTEMWEHSATQRNVAQLAADGVRIVGPESGDLASGDSGVGRLASLEAILEVCGAALGSGDLTGRRVVVTAGPTREPIDPVRFISNRSTGKMGYAVAAAAVRRGATVTLITGPSALTPPAGVEVVPITTTDELLEACRKYTPVADVTVMVAAVADFRPSSTGDVKLPKAELEGGIALTANPDIAAEIGAVKRPGQVLVGFAAQTHDLEAKAREKLVSKNCDFVVANVVGAPGTGFDSDTNQAAFVTSDGFEQLPVMPKPELADRILDRVRDLLDSD